jgi:hypothetical protein
MATAITTPPTGYTVSRSITVDVYSKTGRPDMTLLTDGTYKMLHSTANNAAQDILQRLTPRALPLPPSGP